MVRNGRASREVGDVNFPGSKQRLRKGDFEQKQKEHMEMSDPGPSFLMPGLAAGKLLIDCRKRG